MLRENDELKYQVNQITLMLYQKIEENNILHSQLDRDKQNQN